MNKRGNIAYGIFFVLVLALVVSILAMLVSSGDRVQKGISDSEAIKENIKEKEKLQNEIKESLEDSIDYAYNYYSVLGKYIDDSCDFRNLDKKYYVFCKGKEEEEINMEIKEKVIESFKNVLKEAGGPRNAIPDNNKLLIEKLDNNQYILELENGVCNLVLKDFAFIYPKDYKIDSEGDGFVYISDVEVEIKLSDIGVIDLSNLGEIREKCSGKINNKEEYQSCWKNNLGNFVVNVEDKSINSENFNLVQIAGTSSSVDFLIR